MKKDSYWFHHDSNAKDDPKCMLLIDQLGMEGYGIYWMLLEVLREQPDYRCPLKLVSVLAKRYNTTTEKVKTVICSYDLFRVEKGELFFSRSLVNRMQAYDKIKMLRSKAGKVSADRRKLLENKQDNGEHSAPVQHLLNNCSTNRIEKNIIKENSKKKDELSFTDRQQNFHDSLKGYVEQYGKDTIRAFYDYWSEPNKTNTRMRFELQKTWSLVGRLRTWQRRSKNEK